MTWDEAMRRFGSDKPDLRIALELVDVADALKHVEFKVFAEPANDPAGRVAALAFARWRRSAARRSICSPNTSRYGAKGLAWLKVEDLAKGREGVNSPVAKFLDDAALDAVLKATGAQSGRHGVLRRRQVERPLPTSWAHCG
jgi:aspartyl-tRNA synthetase